MNRAERREVWAEALVDVLQAARQRDGREVRILDPVVDAAIRGVRDDTQTAMGNATSSNERDKLYERHRALSEIIRRLGPGEEKK